MKLFVLVGKPHSAPKANSPSWRAAQPSAAFPGHLLAQGVMAQWCRLWNLPPPVELALADLQGSRGDKDHVQLPLCIPRPSPVPWGGAGPSVYPLRMC